VLVLVTNREDLTADWLVLELERRSQPFIRVSTEDYPTCMGIELTPDHARLHLGAMTLDAEAITSVWWRRPLAPTITRTDTTAPLDWAVGEAQVAWEGFWRTVDAHWVNHPSANERTDCKPFQLREARRHGLLVPPTVITNRIEVARSFQAEHGAIVCKPLRESVVPTTGGTRALYTQQLNANAFDRVGSLGPEPYLLQAFVDKTADIRATVIGDQIFATRIDSQAAVEATVDWRLGVAEELHHESIALDDRTAGQLRAITAAFGLRFAAIDLAIDHDGRYFFFEVNPNGQWAWIEQLTGQPLRAALANELQAPR